MSAVPAQKFREAVLQVLFSLEIASSSQEALEELLSKELGVPRRVIADAWTRAMLVLADVDSLDQQLSQGMLRYDYNRVSALEKTILRLGCYELLVDDAIPPKVAIAEALRLTRKFSSPQAAAFVNAVLDNLYKKSEGETVDEAALTSTAEAMERCQEISEEAAAHEGSPPTPEE
jgi:N utilization substance protein B